MGSPLGAHFLAVEAAYSRRTCLLMKVTHLVICIGRWGRGRGRIVLLLCVFLAVYAIESTCTRWLCMWGEVLACCLSIICCFYCTVYTLMWVLQLHAYWQYEDNISEEEEGYSAICSCLLESTCINFIVIISIVYMHILVYYTVNEHH